MFDIALVVVANIDILIFLRLGLAPSIEVSSARVVFVGRLLPLMTLPVVFLPVVFLPIVFLPVVLLPMVLLTGVFLLGVLLPEVFLRFFLGAFLLVVLLTGVLLLESESRLRLGGVESGPGVYS